MKKNFVKKLSVALALAMTVSTLAPAANADAAAAPAFKSYKTSVYENGTNNGSYTYTVKNIKKGYTVKWSVSGDAKDYVKVSKSSTKAAKTTVSNKITVKTNGEAAAKDAKATVTAKVYNTKNKLVKTVKDSVTVKVQATGVAINAADGSNFVTAVGEKYDLNRTLTPANSTSKTYWTVDSTDATIDSKGVLTATKAGEYTVTATVKNAKTSKTLTTTTQKVVVKEAVLKSVKQTKANELEAVFAGDISKVKTTDIVITRTSDNVVFPVSKITVDKTDKTKATLTTFSSMDDGKDYTVVYGETTLSFKATDGKATSIVIDPVTVPYNTETEINVIGKDAQGVEVFKVNKTNAASEKVDFTIETTQGYVTDENLVLFEKGNTAKATATLHTYEYNTDGTEKGAIKTEATITAVDPTAVSLTGTRYTVAKSLNWDKAVNTKLSVDDKNYSLFFELKNSNDKVVTSKYTKLESSDTNTLLLGTATPGDTSSVELKPVKEGTAYVLVKDDKDNVVASFAVTVIAERKATSIVFDKNSVTLSNSVENGDSSTVKVTVKDQYGDDMPGATAKAELVSAPSKTATGVTPTGGTDEVTFNATKGATKGSYAFKVTASTLERMINVVVSEADTKAPSIYKLALSETKVDTTVNVGDTDVKSIIIKPIITETKGNVKVDTVKASDITKVQLFDSKGVEVTTGAAIITEKEIHVTDVAGKDVTKNLEPGSYTVKVTYMAKDNTKDDPANAPKVEATATAGFVVEDNQPGLTYTVKANESTKTDLKEAVEELVEFYYNGKKLEASAIQTATAGVVSGKLNARVKVTLLLPVDTNWNVTTTVTLNQTITLN